MRPRSPSSVSSRRSTPSSRMRALLGVPEAQQQVGDGGLAGARRSDQRDRRAGRHVEVDIRQRRTLPARIGEAHMLEAHGRAAARRGGNARAVGDRHRLRMHHMQPACGCNRIGKLAADLGDLGNRQERRDRHQHQQRQQRRRDPAVHHQRRADRGDRQTAEAGRHFQPGGLSREVVQQRRAASPGSAAHTP